MPELTLTDEEKEAESFLDWSDDALGKMVRATAQKIQSGELGEDSEPVMMTAAMLVIVLAAKSTNADTLEQTLEGVTHQEHQMGDWKITVERID